MLPSGSNLKLDIHYYHIDRMDSSGSWISLSGGYGCEDPGYRVRSVAGDNKWVEEIP